MMAKTKLIPDINDENLTRLIKMLEEDTFEEKYIYQIVKAATEKSITKESLEILLQYSVNRKKRVYVSMLLIAKFHPVEPHKIIDFFRSPLVKKNQDLDDQLNLVKGLICSLIDKNEPFENIQIYEQFLVSDYHVTIDNVYAIEIERLLDNYFEDKHYYIGNTNNEQQLKNVQWLLSKVKGTISYKNLFSHTFTLIDGEEYQRVKDVYGIIYPKVGETKNEFVWSHCLVAAIKLTDRFFFDFLYSEIKRISVNDTSTLFNIACGLAHFGAKTETLEAIKTAVQAGKKKQQFLDDTDFETYWNDEDFLNVLTLNEGRSE
jgi:hypothetical protein